MLGVTLFGILLTPVFYYVLQWRSERRGAPAEAVKVRVEVDGSEASPAAATPAEAE